MNKIPTAGEFLEMHPQISHYYDDKLKLMVVPAEQVYQAMIEFAKLHVEEALKAADEKATVTPVDHEEISEGSWRPVYGVDSDSILNAYPLEIIK